MTVVAASHAEEHARVRRARGLDRFDEVWNGELHMNPPPSSLHQEIATRLVAALVPVADALGMVALMEAGYFDPARPLHDYRQPDVYVARREHMTPRGLEGPAELVVEIRSPHDETYLKLDFYARHGARQLLVVEPETRAIELYVLVDGSWRVAEPGDDGVLHLVDLPVALATVDGPRLEVTTPPGTVAI